MAQLIYKNLIDGFPISCKEEEEFLRTLLTARIFLFDELPFRGLDRDYRAPNIIENEAEIGLPFQTCWFECVENGTQMPLYRDDNKSFETPSYVMGCLVHEIEPGKFQVSNLSYHGSKHIYALSRYLPEDGTGEMVKSAIALLLQAMQKRSIATERTSLRFKKSAPVFAQNREIKQVVRITSKPRGSALASTLGGSVDWSHRWEVCGHWRRISGIGKDRTGKYCVGGFTWVFPYEKGPESAPLVIKTRIVS